MLRWETNYFVPGLLCWGVKCILIFTINLQTFIYISCVNNSLNQTGLHNAALWEKSHSVVDYQPRHPKIVEKYNYAAFQHTKPLDQLLDKAAYYWESTIRVMSFIAYCYSSEIWACYWNCCDWFRMQCFILQEMWCILHFVCAILVFVCKKRGKVLKMYVRNTFCKTINFLSIFIPVRNGATKSYKTIKVIYLLLDHFKSQ